MIDSKWLMVIVFIVSVLALRYIFFFVYQPTLRVGELITFTTTLLDEPKSSARFNRFTAEYANAFGSTRILITYAPTIHLHYGQTVSVVGRVEDTVLGKTHVHTMYMPTLEAIPRSGNAILALSYGFRQKIQEIYFSALDRQDATLLLGIVLGVKGSFSKNFSNYLQQTGVLHVIAASGMNVSLIGGVFFSLALNLFRRQFAIGITCCGVLFYMITAGLQPSIVRAGIMAIFALSAQFFGRQYSAIYGLFLAASGMMIYNPSLLWDVGFQLSVFSTLGILLIKPLLPQGKLFDDITTTIAAQIMTLPILLVNFGSYGILSILVNTLVLWTIPPLMILGGLGGVLGMVVEPVGNLLLQVCRPFLWYFIHVVSWFGSLGWNITLITLPMALILGYYLLVFTYIFSKKS